MTELEIAMVLPAADGTTVSFMVPLAWAAEAAQRASPTQEYRNGGLVIRGLSDGGLHVTDEQQGTTYTVPEYVRHTLADAKIAALIGTHIDVERTGVGIDDSRREVVA